MSDVEPPGSEPSLSVYRQSIVIDGLNVSNWDSPAVFESLHRGGITASNATTAVWQGYRETLDHIAGWQQRFERHSDILLQVKTVDDIHRAKRAAKAGIIFGWQNASPIENDLERPDDMPHLAAELLGRGYGEEDVAKILGGNFLRLFTEVWA